MRSLVAPHRPLRTDHTRDATLTVIELHRQLEELIRDGLDSLDVIIGPPDYPSWPDARPWRSVGVRCIHYSERTVEL